MEIILYNNNTEKNALYKELSDGTHIFGTLRDSTEIINPVITIKGDAVPTFNYLKIPEFNRYYFITGIKSIRNGIYEITAHVDVLFTYRPGILGNYAIISKSETIAHGSKYVNDGSYVVSVKQYTNSLTFNNKSGYTNFLETPEHILITAG